MKMRLTGVAFSAVILLGSASSANALLLTTDAGIASPSTVTFAPFGGVGNRVDGTGPTQVGTEVGEDIIFTSTSRSSFVGDTTGYNLIGNGSWTPAFGPFTGSNAASVAMTYTFNTGPVSVVGGFMNYVPGDGPVLIEVLDAAMMVLESYDLEAVAAISTPGGTNEGAFRGISRGANDIHAFRVVDNFVVLDDLTFARLEQVPVPGTLAIFGLGLAALRVSRRRKTL